MNENVQFKLVVSRKNKYNRELTKSNLKIHSKKTRLYSKCKKNLIINFIYIRINFSDPESKHDQRTTNSTQIHIQLYQQELSNTSVPVLEWNRKRTMVGNAPSTSHHLAKLLRVALLDKFHSAVDVRSNEYRHRQQHFIWTGQFSFNQLDRWKYCILVASSGLQKICLHFFPVLVSNEARKYVLHIYKFGKREKYTSLKALTPTERVKK